MARIEGVNRRGGAVRRPRSNDKNQQVLTEVRTLSAEEATTFPELPQPPRLHESSRLLVNQDAARR